jgi:tetratricopeptide (TPR) repeat protein
MKRMTLAAAVLIVLAALAPVALLAVSQARINGTVTDQSGTPIEGAAITVTTPSLTNFKLTFKSDKSGKWGTILNDATLPYHVKIEKEGFAPYEVDEKIAIGDNFFLQSKLQPSGAPAAPAAAAKGPAPVAAPSGNEQAVQAFNSGVESLNAGDKAAAEKNFLEATKKNPDLPNAWQALTQLAYEKKDWAKTLEYGKKATDLDPSMANLYGMMAEAGKQSGDAKAAADYGAKFREANPEANAGELYNQGVAAYNKGKMKEAEASLTKAVEAKPDWADAHYLLGMAAFNQNKKDLAKEHLSKYLELAPTGKEAGTVKEILPLLK